jgi:hypothetical protein
MGNALSFEEDAVFASRSGQEDGSGSPSEGRSSPSSGTVPATVSDSSLAEDGVDGDRVLTMEMEMDEAWEEGWEEEYKKAVEDDGGPDDLVLGLLDEEEKERSKWEARQKALARQYAG